MAGLLRAYLNPPAATSLPPYAFTYIASTRGDSVGFIAERTALNAVLGEIDTANEAGLAFLSMGVEPACDAISETADAYDYTTPFVPGGCETAAFAERPGAAAVCGARVVTPDKRSLLAAALENAVEGCVREAWKSASSAS
jgi:hypothetical protein